MKDEIKNLIVVALKARMGNMSQNAFAEQIGISAAHMSNVLTGKLGAVSDELWAQLYCRAGKIKIPRIETQNYTEVIGLCRDAQENQRLLAISADTGLGKTTALKAYQKANPNVFYMLCTGSMSSRIFAEGLSLAMGMGDGRNASRNMQQAASALSRLDRPLLILDDAGKLGTKAYPLIQELRDRTEDEAGIVIAGMPYLRKFVQQGVQQGWNGLAEFHRRVGKWIDLRRPSADEVATLCGFAGITAKPTVKYIFNWATNFGLLNELLENALRASAAGNDINDQAVIRALQVGDAHLN